MIRFSEVLAVLSIMNVKKLAKKVWGVREVAEWLRVRRIVDARALPVEARVAIMMDKYEARFGYRMDIRDPKTYTEKLQWYKAYYIGDGHLDRIVDKYLFKQYVQEKLGDGYTVPLLGMWTDIDSLERDWAQLPEEFCLKSNVQSEGKWIEFIHNKSAVNFRAKRRQWKKWFDPKLTLIVGPMQAYRNCVPRIIAEQYLENIKNQLFDYKVFCFGGQPFCVEAAMERFTHDGPSFSFYDLEWNKMDVTSGHHPNHDVPKPVHFDEMLEISKTLSKDFPHVRVDFFDTEEKLYVAELTLYTGGGYSIYEPQSFNDRMGEHFILPSDQVEL